MQSLTSPDNAWYFSNPLVSFICLIFKYNFSDSRNLWWSWYSGFLERCITITDHGMLKVNIFHAEGVLLIVCSLTQVSNPSIQFMLYEAMLSKIRKRRNSNRVTALEVLCHFATLHNISFHSVMSFPYIFSYIALLLYCYWNFPMRLDISSWSFG